MWRISRQIKDVQTSLPPNFDSFFDNLRSVNSSVIQNYHRRFLQFRRENLQPFKDKLAVEGLLACFNQTLIASAQKRKTIQARTFLRWHKNFFIGAPASHMECTAQD